MKVYLGNYIHPTTSNIYTRYMDKKYGDDWDKSTTRFERFLEKSESLLDRLYNLTINKLKPKEAISYIKIDDYDTWSADYTLAQIILPMLEQLKATKHGSPFVKDEDVPLDLRNSHLDKFNSWSDDPEEQAKTEERDRLLHAKWDWVMDEMIFAFTMKLDTNWESKYYEFEHLDKTNPEYSDHLLGLKLMWEDRESRQKVQERISNGFRLFGTYYEGLWD